MTPWFLRDSERLALERKGVEDLSKSTPWLVGTEWKLDGGLFLDAVIRAHDHDYEVRVSFPNLYPDAPITVRPLHLGSRISSHQYGGADGPLCLEWGPDNWHRDVTVVEMLESAYKLFETENPLGTDRPEIPERAPSRHTLTIGQELRTEWARWYESSEFADFIAAQPINSAGGFKFSLRKKGENWNGLIHEAAPLGGAVWNDDQIPTNLPGAQQSDLDVGVWFKTDFPLQSIGEPKTFSDLKALLEPMQGARFLVDDGTSPVEGFKRSFGGILIVDSGGGSHLFIVLASGAAIQCTRVSAERVPIEQRAPDARALSGKAVGIVGLGSAGSKIALSLARMGVRKFYLVDHDILLPENLRRHALDWRGVLEHKVNAMASAIKRVGAGIVVDVSRLHITGQESNAAVSGALDRLAQCDLLIDATANPRVFNLLASLARSATRPMIWLEIFGGGIGGLVARSRPNLDPTPQDMRGAYLQFCTDHPDPTTKKSVTDYAVEMESGEVLVASDADVSVIAQHAARFAPDCFVGAEQSKFPYSMYLVGLAKGWVFEAPYATIPISMVSYPITGWMPTSESEIKPETEQFLARLLEKPNDAIADTAKNRDSTD